MDSVRQDFKAGEVQDLVSKAKAVAEKAHAPYSRFRVGCAVLGERGVYLGTNVENASFGLGLCAERSALAAATAAGECSIRAIAVACIDAPEGAPTEQMTPCGACRQWIIELAPSAKVIIAATGATFTIEELLPHAFQLETDRGKG